MNNKIILAFLKAGLVDVQGEDSKLQRLEETATDLATLLKANPAKAIEFTLVALDPETPISDPTLQGVATALEQRWITYANTFATLPVTVLRAILLEGLAKAASDMDEIGIVVVSLARNNLPAMEVANETKIWSELISALEHRIDTRAVDEWTTPERIEVAAMKYTAPASLEISSPDLSLNNDALAAVFEKAVGPQGASNRTTNGNPHWPGGNWQWVEQFGKQMAIAISTVVEQAAKDTKVKPVNLGAPLKTLASTVSSHVDATLKAVSSATAGLQRRTNLIWWKESLYSPTARTSYREVPPFAAAALMALDLHGQVPLFSPASVIAFLHETSRSLTHGHSIEPRSLRELAVETRESKLLEGLREQVSTLFEITTARVPVLGIVNAASASAIPEDAKFRERVGVSAEIKLTPAEWATWVYRELQAGRAAQTPGEKAGAPT